MTKAAFLASLLCACSVQNPSTSTEAWPPFAFHDATQSEQEAAVALWEKEAACVGLEPTKARLIPFTVIEGQPMYCGDVLAAGCTTDRPPSIKVRREWFSPNQCKEGYGPDQCHVAATELLHLALLLHGEDWGYSNVAFQRCVYP